MARYLELFSKKYEAILDRIDFHLINNSDVDADIFFQPVVSEKIAVSKREKDKVYFEVARTVGFDPEGIYELTVQFNVIASTENEAALGAISDNDLIRLIGRDRNSFLFSVLSRISLLAAQITSANGEDPIILPPIMLNTDEDKQAGQ